MSRGSGTGRDPFRCVTPVRPPSRPAVTATTRDRVLASHASHATATRSLFSSLPAPRHLHPRMQYNATRGHPDGRRRHRVISHRHATKPQVPTTAPTCAINIHGCPCLLLIALPSKNFPVLSSRHTYACGNPSEQQRTMATPARARAHLIHRTTRQRAQHGSSRLRRHVAPFVGHNAAFVHGITTPLYIPMPASDYAPPSPSGSAASDGSSNSASTGPPRTPVSTAPPLAMPTFMNFTGEDTINERRATHNVVERQCRETLNGRFLDLASLLSNLNQIHRPSKSAIVNSSIAYLNASCRHRIPAAQQLRAMKNEAHALRHELNEWRSRAGVAFIDEPIRGDAFGASWKGGAYAGTHYAPEPTDEYAHAHLQRQQPEHAEMLAQAQLQQAAFGHAAPVGHALPPQGRHPQPIIIPPPQPSPVPRSRRSTIPQQAARSRPAGILVNTPASNHNETLRLRTQADEHEPHVHTRPPTLITRVHPPYLLLYKSNDRRRSRRVPPEPWREVVYVECQEISAERAGAGLATIFRGAGGGRERVKDTERGRGGGASTISAQRGGQGYAKRASGRGGSGISAPHDRPRVRSRLPHHVRPPRYARPSPILVIHKDQTAVYTPASSRVLPQPCNWVFQPQRPCNPTSTPCNCVVDSHYLHHRRSQPLSQPSRRSPRTSTPPQDFTLATHAHSHLGTLTTLTMYHGRNHARHAISRAINSAAVSLPVRVRNVLCHVALHAYPALSSPTTLYPPTFSATHPHSIAHTPWRTQTHARYPRRRTPPSRHRQGFPPLGRTPPLPRSLSIASYHRTRVDGPAPWTTLYAARAVPDVGRMAQRAKALPATAITRPRVRFCQRFFSRAPPPLPVRSKIRSETPGSFGPAESGPTGRTADRDKLDSGRRVLSRLPHHVRLDRVIVGLHHNTATPALCLRPTANLRPFLSTFEPGPARLSRTPYARNCSARTIAPDVSTRTPTAAHKLGEGQLAATHARTHATTGLKTSEAHGVMFIQGGYLATTAPRHLVSPPLFFFAVASDPLSGRYARCRGLRGAPIKDIPTFVGTFTLNSPAPAQAWSPSR
ncbi:hypothetical protein K438DRAFT_1963522 [Mycena galopus ATCC 62051]|nr:hypothetical protein K438DRAFT_1963522 [Mycena galopus ATCC 62051]